MPFTSNIEKSILDYELKIKLKTVRQKCELYIT